MDDVLVRCGDLEAHGNPGGGAQRVDRDGAVRILVLPGVLAPGDAHFEPLLALCARGGNVGDPGQLVEDEAADQDEDDDGRDRPHELEARRAVDLRSVVEALPSPAPIAPDERDEQNLDEDEDRDDEDRHEEPHVGDPLGVRRLGRHGSEAPVLREGDRAASSGEEPGTGRGRSGARTGCHSMNVPESASRGTRVRLPPDVARPFEIYVNGVPQEEGRDFRIEGRTLVFEQELKGEGKLGFWRWLSMWVGVAGTYRQNDSVDVVYQRNGKRVVETKLPLEPA